METPMFAEKKKRIIVVAVLAIGVVGGSVGTGIAVATGGDDDQPITGSALAACTQAALSHTGGGTVTETEVGDDGAAYEVEIRLADGSEVEVNFDENCQVTGQESDDDDGPDDDPDENENDDD